MLVAEELEVRQIGLRCGNRVPPAAELTFTSARGSRQRRILKAHSAKVCLDPDVIESTRHEDCQSSAQR
jgi:hypothetical protein